MSTAVEIDDSLYSRQRYVVGEAGMRKIRNSKIIIIGLGGVGVEIAKNLILSGIKEVILQDWRSASNHDLAAQFYITPDDVAKGRNRAEASAVHLAELNPQVTLKVVTSETLDFYLMSKCKVVVLSECSTRVVREVDKFCHYHMPPIKLIVADVRGVFGQVFCDFGPKFEVKDPTGEDPKEFYVEKITRGNPGVVTCVDQQHQELHTGDRVSFSLVKGMTELNGTVHPITVLNSYQFSIGDTSAYSLFECGMATSVMSPLVVNHLSYEEAQIEPKILECDFAVEQAALNSHIAFVALERFQENYNRLPEPWQTGDAQSLYNIATIVAKDLKLEGGVKAEVNLDFIRGLSFSAKGVLPPLCSVIGGLASHEALKGVTDKFVPITQWLYINAMELQSQNAAGSVPGDPRYEAVLQCCNETLLRSLAECRLFMVGCGAIGCELLKILALLGCCTSGSGKLVVTDNDLIEKSNLNRQFLFRPCHVRQPKSKVAGESVKQICPGMVIETLQHKVCKETEQIFSDEFFKSVGVVLNALDNVEARLYVDSRCVSNEKNEIDSGTLGPKGHVQVIVPHLTESYSSQRDPPEKEIPFCTLKTFPSKIDHTIQWAKNKFESLFNMKPSEFSKFWATHGTPDAVMKALENDHLVTLEEATRICKILKNLPTTWDQCVVLARDKFQKYFNTKAKQLLSQFPLDSVTEDGHPFWNFPKRPPKPIEFNFDNQTHVDCITAFARLLAFQSGVSIPKDVSAATLRQCLKDYKPIEFVPTAKKVALSDDDVEEQKSQGNVMDAETCRKILAESTAKKLKLHLVSVEFEKDDDSHIDFVTAVSNLRAAMYGLEEADRYKTKLIAGKIIPAIASTTAIVAGLVCIELMKVVAKQPVEKLKNSFLDLGCPSLIFSQPAPPAGRKMFNNTLVVTEWDRWEVKGNPDFTLQQFADHFKEKFHFDLTLVAIGNKPIYMKMLPDHEKRKTQRMIDLCSPTERPYVDLMISLEPPDGAEDQDVDCPVVRYWFGGV